MSESEAHTTQNILIDYYHKIDAQPGDPEIWNELLLNAQTEETKGRSPDWLSGISCKDLIQIHDQITRAGNSQEKFALLAQKAPDGKLWYDHILGKTNRSEAKPLLNFINYHDYKLVVDVGTGSGDSLVLSDPDRRVIGVDISKSLLQSVPKQHSPLLTLADAARLPLETDSVDCIYSYGLTHYLTKDKLNRFAAETSRVLGPGGVYLEPQTINEPGDIPSAEEYLTENFKSLLILVLDRLVTADAEGAATTFNNWISTFEKQGLKIITHRNENDIVFEFRKQYSKELAEAGSAYIGGDENEAGEYIKGFLHPEHYFRIVQGKHVYGSPLTLSEWKKRMDEYRRFGSDEDIIQATTQSSDYYYLCVAPLLSNVTNQQQKVEFQPSAVKVLEQNIHVFTNQVIDLGSQHWSHTDDRDLLVKLRKDLIEIPSCMKIIKMIEEVLGTSESKTG